MSKFGVCPCQAPQDLPLAGFFTPGTWPNRFAKAAEIGADVLIIDLEDAVAPDDKPGARKTALDFASQRKETANAVAIRINGLDTPPGIADVDALLASDAAPDYLVVPKTSRPTQGIVTVCTRGLNQDGKEVMTFERTMLVNRRSHSPEDAAGY